MIHSPEQNWFENIKKVIFLENEKNARILKFYFEYTYDTWSEMTEERKRGKGR